MLILLLAAAAVEPAAQPVIDLKQRVVDAIRNCPKAVPGEIVVCSRDRGFSEGQRVRPLRKPVVPSSPIVTVQTSGGAPGGAMGNCARVGAAAAIGCSQQDYDDWRRRRERDKAGEDKP